MIKKIFLILVFMCLFITPVYAQEGDWDDIYSQQFDDSGLEDVDEYLDEEVRLQLEEYGFSTDILKNSDSFSAQNVFNIILGYLGGSLKGPLTVFLSVLGVSLIIGAIKSVEPESGGVAVSDIVGVSSTVATVITPAFAVFKSAVAAVKSAAVFMGGFVPVFAGILVSSGRITTSSMTGATIMLSAQTVEQIGSFVILPLVSVQLVISIAASFNDRINISSLSQGLKKGITFCMTAVMGIFSAVVSLQGMIGNSTDSMSLRTFKAVAGSTPVIGGAVSEASGLIMECLKTLRGSAVIYAVVCFAVIMLPMIIEILLWRVSMFMSKTVAAMLGADKIADLCDSVGYSFGIVTSVIVNTFVMFIISLTVIILTGGGA